ESLQTHAFNVYGRQCREAFSCFFERHQSAFPFGGSVHPSSGARAIQVQLSPQPRRGAFEKRLKQMQPGVE
ncbi:MAG: hypothetical protein P8Q36_17545, partial [Alphaproteobacteria bacterium]|nr:hypothetical protein [Alphaproteobacteria bacterium]